MTEQEFYKDIGHHICAEHMLYSKNLLWPYVDWTLGPSPIGDAGSFMEFAYSYPHRVTAVFWGDAKISVASVRPGDTAVSFDFSGCYMARFKMGGRLYACHIHSSSERGLDRKADWNAFYTANRSQITDAVLFRPVVPDDEYYALLLHHRMTCQTRQTRRLSGCGVITPGGDCFAAVIDNRTFQVHEHRIRRMNPIPGNLIPIP